MTLSAYLETLTNQTSTLGKINARAKASAVVPLEMRTELQKCIDSNLKTFLNNVLAFLNKHPGSPLHELMAVEFLLANINFAPKITEKLNEIKTEIAQTIQNLYYLLEKPHPETASSGYNERRRAQEDHLKKEIQADKARGEEDDPLMLLALQYCLKNMDNDTYIYLTKDLPISAEVTGRSSLANLQGKLFNFALYGQTDPKYFAALVTLEFYRVSPANLTEEKHAAKNQRFYEEITKFLGGNTAAKPLLSQPDASSSTGLISPPRLGFSHESSSVLSEDGKRVHDEPTPLSIQTVRASGMVFHFSVSLPQSSIDLLARIQLGVSASTQAVNKGERDPLWRHVSDERSIQSFGPDSCEQPVRPSQLEYETDHHDNLHLPGSSDQVTPETAEVKLSETQPLLSVIVECPEYADPLLSPVKYEVPPSGNCCYSSIIVALMHGFFSRSIQENSATAQALDRYENFFNKIEKTIGIEKTVRMKREPGQSIIQKFEYSP